MASKPDITKNGELGNSGVYFSGGVISGEEYNFDLVGRAGLDVYDQMRRNDATVKASLRALKLPVKSAEYRVDAFSADQKDIDIAEVVRYCLFTFVDWKKFLGEALTALDFGFAVFEMVFEPRYINGTLRIALVKMGFRKQRTIWSWLQQDKTPGIQQTLMDGHTVSIPLAKLVHIAPEQEGDNYEGISILRTAYKHWKIKDKLYIIDAVGAENQALGIADIVVPKGASEKDKKSMENWARSRRANEVAYIMRPEGWEVGIMDMKANSLKDIEPSINHHDRQIMKNVLAAFLEIGSRGSSGTRNVSEDQSRLFELACKEVAEHIIQAVQKTAVQTIVDLNFTDANMPTLAVGNISDENIPVVTEAINKLVTAGILHPNAADENFVRKLVKMPQRDEEELAAVYTAKDAATKDAAGNTASVTELKALRASVEKALYDEPRQAA